MDATTSTLSGIRVIQGALKIIAALQLTAYLWPPHAHIQDGAVFDYIVVGAGSAGSVVAGRLSEDPNVNVLLIEAGGDAPIESSMPITTMWSLRSGVDWNFVTESNKIYGQCHQNSHLPVNNGKMIGGTGSFNFMLYSRGIPEDYNKWTELVDDDTWSWENVLPHFKAIEKFNDPEYLAPDQIHHGTEGALSIKQLRRNEGRYLQGYKEMGYFIGNLNEAKTVGYSPMMISITDGVRHSSAHAYLTPAKERKNLHVLKNTLVTKILFDEAKNAEGIKAMTPDGKLVTYKATKEVIISAGVFNTPKLLLLSGIGPKEHLEQHNIKVLSDLPVGQNLQDHISVSVPMNLEKNKYPIPPRDSHVFAAEAGYVGLAALDKNSKLPDYETYTFVTTWELAINFFAFHFQYSNEVCNHIHRTGENRLQSQNQVVHLKPKSKGQVLLQSINPEDPPLIETNYLSDNDDLEKLIDYVEDFVQIVNTTYFRSIEAEVVSVEACKEFVEGSRDYWRCYSACMMSGVQNYIGTARMGSVVDSRLRVYGVNRLRVADASVMPSLISGSTYAPVLMIAEKLVDFIRNNK